MTDWIEWRGGACPVPLATTVEVRYRGGVQVRDFAAYFLWGAIDSFSQIIAYRVVVQAPKAKDDDWIKHVPWYRHDGGPIPCPVGIWVETPSRGGALNCTLVGLAEEHRWDKIRYWRPVDDRYEFTFDGDRLVAYRLKEAHRD